MYPDVFLGRLACVDESEVTSCVNKIISYENNKAYGQDWFFNLLLVGGDSSVNFPNTDPNKILEGEYMNKRVS